MITEVVVGVPLAIMGVCTKEVCILYFDDWPVTVFFAVSRVGALPTVFTA